MATTLKESSPRTRAPTPEPDAQRGRNGEGHAPVGAKFRHDGTWAVLQTSESLRGVDPLHGQLGKPGVWKFVRNPRTGKYRAVFELPSATLHPDDEDGDEMDLEAQCVEWAFATARGHIPDGWVNKPREEVLSWLPARGLTLQAGPHLRQGALLHSDTQLSLRMPILPKIPDNLPAGRREWIEELLLESQSQWRLVRTGFTEQGGIEAEVNLTGAPDGVVEPLIRTSLDSLRWVVERLMGPMVLLADPSLSSRALETIPARAVLARKEESNGHP